MKIRCKRLVNATRDDAKFEDIIESFIDDNVPADGFIDIKYDGASVLILWRPDMSFRDHHEENEQMKGEPTNE